MRWNTRRAESGFTLIEMIVALAILSLSLGVLFGGFSQALNRSRLNAAQMNARVLAQSLLAQAGAAGPQQGVTADGLSWTLRLAPFGSADDAKAWHPAPVQVTATVSWTSGGEQRSLSLTTLRFAPVKADHDRP